MVFFMSTTKLCVMSSRRGLRIKFPSFFSARALVCCARKVVPVSIDWLQLLSKKRHLLGLGEEGSMSEEDGRRLFSEFANAELTERLDLEVISRQIVGKMQRSPSWQQDHLLVSQVTSQMPINGVDLLQKEIRELPLDDCHILPTLCLSHYHLLHDEFQRSKLIMLWIAQELVLRQGSETPEVSWGRLH